MSDVWAGIVRVSFVGTRGGDSFHSDKEQVADIERGLPAGGTLEVLEPELDVSGGRTLEERPILLSAIEGVERGDYAGIIVAYLSRLGRNVREQLRAWDRVEAAGGRIIVVREGIDTSTVSGRMQRGILLVIAEGEREQHAERFENDRRRATEAGIWKQPQTPLGYGRDPTTRRLRLNDDAVKVTKAFSDRLAGVAVSTIADDLGMTTSGVRALLRNRVYLGELHHGPYSNLDAHPAIVDRDLFDAVQTTALARPARRLSSEPALLAGLIRCQACGHKMTRGTSGNAAVYICHKRKSGGLCPRAGAITCHLIDPYVGLIADHQLLLLESDLTRRGSELEELRRAVVVAEQRLAAYLAAIEPGDVGPEAYAIEARKRRKAVDDAKAALRRASALRAVPGAGGAVPRWADLTPPEQRTMLRGMVDAVIVKATGRGGSSRPLEERTRVIAAGSGIVLPRKGPGVPMGIVELDWPDADADVVLRVPGG